MNRPRSCRTRCHAHRLRALRVGFTFLAVVYGVRLVHLQAVQGEQWRTAALAQSAREIEIPAMRGRILDFDQRVLAADEARYQVGVAKNELQVDYGQAVEFIAAEVGLTRRQRARLTAAETNWVNVPGLIGEAERARLSELLPRGVHFTAHTARNYPLNRTARALLGAIDRDGRGRSGLELELDSLLQGEPGAALSRTDSEGRKYRIPGEPVAPAYPGLDVVLTIDADLQRIAERQLEVAMAETGAAAGDIILLDPRTGALRAVASHSRESSLRVPAFTDPYEPGSTAKAFLLAALMAEDAVHVDEMVDTEDGVYALASRTIRDVHGYEELSVSDVITFSSNIGAAKLAPRLRPAVQYRYLRDFGFGTRTGVEYPAEAAGRLARPDQWTELSPASLAMGYEMSATSLQIAAAYGALANGGALMQPHLIREVRDASGEVVWRSTPRKIRQVVSPQVARAVTEVLRGVVQVGTGQLANLDRLAVAGKTGTAWLSTERGYARGRYRASFVGYAPFDDPQVVVLTRLEDPQGAYYGGLVAAPRSQATLEAALVTQGVRLDSRIVRATEPHRWGAIRPVSASAPVVFAVDAGPEPPGAGLEARESLVAVPDLSGLPLRAAAARLHSLGLRVRLTGAGAVRGTDPLPGAKVAPGATVVLH